MYTDIEKIIMWLNSFEFLSYKKVRTIVDNFDDLKDLFDSLDDHKSDLLKTIKPEEYASIKENNNLVQVDRAIAEYEKLGIRVVTIKSDTYPELLKETDAPPIMLYCKGNIDLLKTECLAVVGTRRATNYGKTMCKKIVNDVASQGITIVSGLADGIDTVAHKSALEVGGKTIAVLGAGLLNIYPNSNVGLYNDIVERGGLVISEYKPSEPIVNYHFPVRNRIIAGLSKATFVVEAGEKSGSMHTKNYALDYGREVFALPARVNDIYSVGCNKLIKCGQARMAMGSDDFIEFYGANKPKEEKTTAFLLSFDEKKVYDALELNELGLDELKLNTGIEPKVLLTTLMRLEIRGIIKKLPGNIYTIDR